MRQNTIDDVVLSSRIRLARNIEGLPYPHKLNAVAARAIPHDIFTAICRNDNYSLYRMAEISEIDAAVLMEKYLISADLLSNRESGAAIINESETVSIMVNEEDHIREQCILKGFSLKEAYITINAIDDAISKSINFSYHEKLGYLTACPTNLGTGMRASAMLFLPGIVIYNSLETCIKAVTRLNMTIRGVYGEGSDSTGYIFQVSNQKTLGQSEQQIIDSVMSSVSAIVEAEFKARNALLQSGGDELKDKILRAYGILTNAYKIDSKEFMQLIALVKLGVYYGLINLKDGERLDKIITQAQPAGIISMTNKELDGNERDILRASYVAKNLRAITK